MFLETVTTESPFTNQIPAGKFLKVPIAHGEGCYFADEATRASLKANNQILWRYVGADGKPSELTNPNGSVDDIAGICSEARNVAGLMPHPERACEERLNSADGKFVLQSLIAWLENRSVAKAA